MPNHISIEIELQYQIIRFQQWRWLTAEDRGGSGLVELAGGGDSAPRWRWPTAVVLSARVQFDSIPRG